MEAAEREMGLPERTSNETHFSEDTLHIEVHGPTLPQLTLIDLPGLIQNGNHSHKTLVKSITENYIQNERSIILAVLGAHNDRQNQGIADMATKQDPKGERTFGVITKPDIPEPGTPGEEAWIQLAQNLVPGFKFHNGWHVLLNRTELEVIANTSTEDRDENERQFFQNPASNWSKVDRKNWGAQKLEENLVRLLGDHLKRQLPELKMEIEKKLIPIQNEVRRLTASLKSKEDAGEVLQERCRVMRDITAKAVEGTDNDSQDYFGLADQPTWPDDPRFLRAKIEIEGDNFQAKMKSGGRHLRSTWNQDDPPTVAEMEKYIDYVATFLQNSRGEEPADAIQPQRLDLLFHQYSKPWQAIAEEYLGNCRDHCKRFLDNLTITILDPELGHVAKQLQEKQLDKILGRRMQEALAELGKLEKDRLRATKTRNDALLKGSKDAYEKELHRMMTKALSNANTDYGKVPSKIAVDLEMDSLAKRQRAQAVALMPRLHLYYKVCVNIQQKDVTS